MFFAIRPRMQFTVFIPVQSVMYSACLYLHKSTLINAYDKSGRKMSVMDADGSQEDVV